MLYHHYMDCPEELPSEYLRMMDEGEPKDVIVCDYIAGMTDNYAILKFQELFLPKSWSGI